MTYKEKVMASVLEELKAETAIREAIRESGESVEERIKHSFYCDVALFFDTENGKLSEQDYEKLYVLEGEILDVLYGTWLEAEGIGWEDMQDDKTAVEFIKGYCIENFYEYWVLYREKND